MGEHRVVSTICTAYGPVQFDGRCVDRGDTEWMLRLLRFAIASHTKPLFVDPPPPPTESK